MKTVEDLIIELKRLPETIRDGVDRAIIGDSVDIAEINVSQLEKGIDSLGNPFGSYTESTKKIRQKKGLQTNFIDLRDTGKSYDSITTKKIRKDDYELFANPRWDEERFPNAIGVTKKNEKELTKIIRVNLDAVLKRAFSR